MKELRAALNQYVAGTLPRDLTEQRVAAAGARDPNMVPAMLALIDTYRSAGGLNSEFAQALQNALRASPASVPPVSTQPSKAQPSGGAIVSATAQLSIGDVLKGRFVLESIVSGGDRGGMGVVYKALDLIKQEAQDRNPYVAIKVLNESFKQHPDSMKALQREARRAQTLSHPNIINVHDFDRDGSNVFLAMELLDGCALDVLIRRYRKKGGMPPVDALPVIEGMGRALAHAHARGIVHSDFKPGNAFLCQDSTVKVLDFGIARATKLGGGDKTLFDAGKLGALSPAYASCEQFERLSADPADDVYAFAVVTYELLTGRHPFEKPDPDYPDEVIKLDAVSARSAGLKPAPVAGLTRRQWNTLQKGLGFSRADRPRDAGVFLEGMLPRKLPVKTILIGAAGGLLLLVLSSQLLSGYIERMRLLGLTQKLQSADSGIVAPALKKLENYSADERASVLAVAAVQKNLIGYFEQQAREKFNPSAGRYDYRDAIAVIKGAQDLSPLYADSRQLTDFIDRIETDRKFEILRQADLFENRLRRGTLIQIQGASNAQAALAVIAQLDPDHPLLTDKRLPIAIADQTRASLYAGNLPLASALLNAGLALSPTNANLRDLQDQIHRREVQTLQAAQIARLQQALSFLGSDRATLDNFRSQRDQLGQLQRAAPTDPVLTAAVSKLSTLVGSGVSADIQQGHAADAQALLGEFGDFLPAKFVAIQNLGIARVQNPAQTRQNTDSEVQAAIVRLAGTPQTEDAWVNAALGSLDDLDSLVGKNDERVRAERSRISRAYLQQAEGFIAERRLTEAQRALDLGKRFGLSAAAYASAQASLRQTRDQVQADNQQQTASAQLAAAKQRVIDQALADQIDQAESQFAALAKTLPAADSFVVSVAPRAIAGAYLARAQRYFAQAQLEEAVQSARLAQRSAPGIAEYQAASQRFQDARSLAVTLSSVREPREFDKFRPVMDRLRASDPAEYPAFQAGFLRILNDRIRGLDANSAASVRAGVARLFPDASAL